MKKLFTILAILIAFTASAQKVKIDANGNYVAVKQTDSVTYKPTGKTYTDSKGNVFPVHISAAGKLFVIKTSKAGNIYKQYLKLR